ncbi:hypothetical protein L484_014750 [Morus notabilis]|uniref:Uncharacterized protein n=1 Tax=Morus notabilis TaxID=981085 RepID=W9QLY0_9ROSA|nr:hypothetical protein L484_014750 [Morus notabilis]
MTHKANQQIRLKYLKKEVTRWKSWYQVKPLVEGWSAWSQDCGLVRLRLGFASFSTFFLESGGSLLILRLLGFVPLVKAKQGVGSGRGLDLGVGCLLCCKSHHRETKAASGGCAPLGAF